MAATLRKEIEQYNRKYPLRRKLLPYRSQHKTNFPYDGITNSQDLNGMKYLCFHVYMQEWVFHDMIP